MAKAISREQLYEEVWAEAMTKVAERHGVSDVMLAKVCKRLRIPHPPRGHWAKREAGKESPRPALPPPIPGEEIEWCRERYGQAKRAPLPLPKAPDPSTPVVPKRRARKGRHAITVGVEALFLKARDSEHGYLRPYKRTLVDVFVSKERLNEGLEAASLLYRTFESRGHRVRISEKGERLHRPLLDWRGGTVDENVYSIHGGWSPDHPTVVMVGTVAFGIALYEHAEKIPVESVERHYIPADTNTPAFRKRVLFGQWIHEQPMPSGLKKKSMSETT